MVCGTSLGPHATSLFRSSSEGVLQGNIHIDIARNIYININVYMYIYTPSDITSDEPSTRVRYTIVTHRDVLVYVNGSEEATQVTCAYAATVQVPCDKKQRVGVQVNVPPVRCTS